MSNCKACTSWAEEFLDKCTTALTPEMAQEVIEDEVAAVVGAPDVAQEEISDVAPPTMFLARPTAIHLVN
ncbi:hypothetical protein V5799_027317 [Amblyomma americanum]|uniref:Uncharacterized protein n=1 Tax=Amblyomma americanum TaxID=6943 RepID=A0AAQ4DG25_AMBAM